MVGFHLSLVCLATCLLNESGLPTEPPAEELIFTRVMSDGHPTDPSALGTLEVFKGEEAADKVFAFCKQHNQTASRKRTMIRDVCASSRVVCTRKHALLYEQAFR